MSPSDFIFRQASANEVELVYDIIIQRIKWMDQVGIRQWNVTDYLTRFPLEYYYEKQRVGELYVLLEKNLHNNECIVCVAVLKEVDDRWPDDGIKALYLHNFASLPGLTHRVGDIFLTFAEQTSRQMGKACFRLDCAVDNTFLNKYYNERGFVEAGFCTHGLYKGVLRQKWLNEG